MIRCGSENNITPVKQYSVSFKLFITSTSINSYINKIVENNWIFLLRNFFVNFSFNSFPTVVFVTDVETLELLPFVKKYYWSLILECVLQLHS